MSEQLLGWHLTLQNINTFTLYHQIKTLLSIGSFCQGFQILVSFSVKREENDKPGFFGCDAGVGCILASLEKPSRFPLMASSASSLLFSPVWNVLEKKINHSTIQFPSNTHTCSVQDLALPTVRLNPSFSSNIWSILTVTPIFRKHVFCKLHNNSTSQSSDRHFTYRNNTQTLFSYL